ncbi:MAG: NAD(P)-dependent oxidoreductase [Rhodospirillales bacterium 20-60-12]|nr:MAG: NAD(P)-dependent oxidoreductase [Rhodospirillales bacterium 20-60-12]
MKLVIIGLGYSGQAIALAARDSGAMVTVTSRSLARRAPLLQVELVGFDAAQAAIAEATHLVMTAAPDEHGDPALALYRDLIAHAPHLAWLGYLSTTGVYGDRGGGMVDEATVPAPGSDRARRRVAAEQEWAAFAAHKAVDIFRLAGIYGPGRSMLDDLRAGEARNVVKEGHKFSRIHRDDIARGVVAAMRQDLAPGLRIFNFADDEPAASSDVVTYAAGLLGIKPPPPRGFAEAAPMMSDMARSFWAENRLISNEVTKKTLGINWLYPSYREGLAAILHDELTQNRADQQ